MPSPSVWASTVSRIRQEQDALKLFTQRVEDLRNEQRRRQQQLDQPTEQTPPTAAPPV